MTSLASDTFTGTDGAAWSATWTTGRDGSGGGGATIQSNAGRILVGSSPDIRTARRVNITAPVDAVALFKFRFPSATSGNCWAQYFVRSTNTTLDTQGGYRIELDKEGDLWSIAESISYSQTRLTNSLTGNNNTISQTFAYDTWYWAKFGAVGSAIKGKVWADGAGEPAWQWESTDTTYTTAGSGTGITVSGANSVTFEMDDFSLDTAFGGAALTGDATNTLTATQTAAAAFNASGVGANALTWTQTAAIRNSALAAAVNALTMTQTAAMGNARLIAGTNALTLSQSAAMSNRQLLDAVNTLTLAQTADFAHSALMAATNTLTLTQTAVADVSSATNVGIDATQTLTVTQTSNIVNARTIAGTNILVLGQTATASRGQTLAGTNALTLAQVAEASTAQLLDAVNAMVLTQTGGALLNRALDGNNDLVLTQTSAALVTRALDGSQTLTLLQVASFETRVEIESTNPLSFAQTATMTVRPNALPGSTGHGGGYGWDALLAIYRLAEQEQMDEYLRVPTACPICGEPLRTGPRGELFCIADGWQPVGV